LAWHFRCGATTVRQPREAEPNGLGADRKPKFSRGHRKLAPEVVPIAIWEVDLANRLRHVRQPAALPPPPARDAEPGLLLPFGLRGSVYAGRAKHVCPSRWAPPATWSGEPRALRAAGQVRQTGVRPAPPAPGAETRRRHAEAIRARGTRNARLPVALAPPAMCGKPTCARHRVHVCEWRDSGLAGRAEQARAAADAGEGRPAESHRSPASSGKCSPPATSPISLTWRWLSSLSSNATKNPPLPFAGRLLADLADLLQRLKASALPAAA